MPNRLTFGNLVEALDREGIPTTGIRADKCRVFVRPTRPMNTTPPRDEMARYTWRFDVPIQDPQASLSFRTSSYPAPGLCSGYDNFGEISKLPLPSKLYLTVRSDFLREAFQRFDAKVDCLPNMRRILTWDWPKALGGLPIKVAGHDFGIKDGGEIPGISLVDGCRPYVELTPLARSETITPDKLDSFGRAISCFYEITKHIEEILKRGTAD